MGTMFCLDSRRFFISSLSLSRMARDGATLAWLDLVCRPVTSVSLSFLILSFLRDLRREKVTGGRMRESLSYLFPYILSRLPQLVMCGCSCCSNF